MRFFPTPIRLLPALAVAALGFALPGCGTSDVDETRGRQLFIQKCGSCHILAQAATTGVQGPDLDAAFAAARAAGQDGDTIEGVVLNQIGYPRPSDETENPTITMPANLVVGQDAEDVAAYVGRVAGDPDAKPPTVPGGPGAQVFANNGCAGCHTLAAANAGGTTGPNLDEVLQGQMPAQVEQQIVDPNSKITTGFPSNVMPDNYEELIPADQLQLLVDYLVSSTGGTKAAGAGKSAGKKG